MIRQRRKIKTMNESELHSINSEQEIEMAEIRRDESAPTEAEAPRARWGFLLQLRAILLKNLSFQRRQVAMNLFIVLSPLMVVGLIWVARYEMNDSQVKDIDVSKAVGVPFFHNLPTSVFSSSSAYPIVISNCLKWFLVKQETREGLETHDFFHPLFHEHCSAANATVPIFNHIQSDLNSFLYAQMEMMDQNDMKIGEALEDADLLPDAAIDVRKISRELVSLDLQVNDLIFPEYHRDNGFTKLSFKTPRSGLNLFNQTKTLAAELFSKEKEEQPEPHRRRKGLKAVFKDSSATFPMVVTTDGFMSMIDLVTKNFFRVFDDRVKIMSSSSYLDFFSVRSIILSVGFCLMTVVLIPLSTSNFLSSLLYFLVVEKEEKTTFLMFIHGMNPFFYFVVVYVSGMIATLASCAFFVFSCRHILELPLFTLTSPVIVWLVYVLWCHSQVSLAILLHNFSISTKSSLNVSFIISIFTIGGGILLNSAIFIDPLKLPWFFEAIPQVVFTRLLKLLAVACTNDRCVKTWELLDGECLRLFVAFFAYPTLYLGLGVYLASKRMKKLAKTNSFFAAPQSGRNEEIRKRAKAAISSGKVADHALIVSNLSKKFQQEDGSSVHALNDVDILIEKGELLGLLGPNGAGKTTLLNILTGMIAADKGDAFVCGFEVPKEMSRVYSVIGVCPQFDCLWPDLTVEEHFLFYIRLRGASIRVERFILEETLSHMKLTEHRKKTISELSGGMKRRVSIGIAMTGSTKLVFLDEPTSGLDPINRMQIWEILKETRGKKAVLLTTHLMDEADHLCNRIAIIDKGEVLCCDYPSSLKRQFSEGYSLNLITKPEAKPAALETFILGFDPKAKLRTEGKGLVVFSLGVEGEDLMNLAQSVQENRESLMLSGWSLSQSSLKDVFINVVGRVKAR